MLHDSKEDSIAVARDSTRSLIVLLRGDPIPLQFETTGLVFGYLSSSTFLWSLTIRYIGGMELDWLIVLSLTLS